MRYTRPVWILSGAALLGLTACGDFDFDLRNGANGFSTAEAARQASADRPRPDARGVISYPDYQVAVARNGDTVQSVAERLGSNPAELARHNALTPDTSLRAGEVLALPNKIDGGTG
ncbi:MAG: LysM peptidoglycan-binding domain-containing protein, partial [Alphaproteobacteria bacterium]|nr:LysM peptidoglycan-binding domain-containing protein [Alphaproteobacteria bacterium]